MSTTIPRLTGRALPATLSFAAAVTLSLAFGLDYLVGGSPGFGLAQTLILLVSGGIAFVALEAAMPVGGLTVQGIPALSRDAVISALRFAAIAGQLALLVAVARAFRLESPAFHNRILVVTAVGFLIHAALPLRWRLSFFLLLSISGIQLVFGAAAFWIIGIGLALAGICHLPISFGKRVAILLAVGATLALARAEVLTTPVPGAIWPILGSMFMFRLIVYMYDLRHAREPGDWRRTLSYFFLLPNVVFPLFPVVDWTVFRRTYYDQPSFQIYQRGVEWMARGFVHLLLYRAVDSFFALSPAQVTSAPDFVHFMVANYLLYLRVSGQFHLIVGMLHLFGFRLPETHHWFFLASSFTDFWRRINIYWKDFMMKVVYYPAFFRFRKLGTMPGVIVATLLVFLSTWVLHAYQWFWLLGAVLLTGPDIMFWSLLALLLVVNTVLDVRRGARGRPQTAPTPRTRAITALRTALFFATMCVLWSLWSSESLHEWTVLWHAAISGTGSAP